MIISSFAHNTSRTTLRYATSTRAASRASHSTTRIHATLGLPSLPPHALTPMCIVVARLLHLLLVLALLRGLQLSV